MFTPPVFLKWRDGCYRFVRSLCLSCVTPAMCTVTGDRCVPAAVSHLLRQGGYFASLPAWRFKNGQYSSMVRHLSSAAQGCGFSGCCGSWGIVFAALRWSFLSFEQNLPDKKKVQLSSFCEKSTGHAKVSSFSSPLCQAGCATIPVFSVLVCALVSWQNSCSLCYLVPLCQAEMRCHQQLVVMCVKTLGVHLHALTCPFYPSQMF